MFVPFMPCDPSTWSCEIGLAKFVVFLLSVSVPAALFVISIALVFNVYIKPRIGK